MDSHSQQQTSPQIFLSRFLFLFLTSLFCLTKSKAKEIQTRIGQRGINKFLLYYIEMYVKMLKYVVTILRSIYSWSREVRMKRCNLSYWNNYYIQSLMVCHVIKCTNRKGWYVVRTVMVRLALSLWCGEGSFQNHYVIQLKLICTTLTHLDM